MKAFKVVMFLLVMLVLSTQFARHFYVRYLEPRASVLDKYEQTETKKAIKTAESLDELLSRYEAAKKRVDALDGQRKAAESDMSKDKRGDFREQFREEHKEDYKSTSDLKEAITEWEKSSKKIFELRMFWLFGFVLFLAGAIFFVKGHDWLGMAFIVPGVVEMIWWTSPSFRFAGSPNEFERLLMNKLFFTAVTLILVIASWVLNERSRNHARDD